MCDILQSLLKSSASAYSSREVVPLVEFLRFLDDEVVRAVLSFFFHLLTSSQRSCILLHHMFQTLRNDLWRKFSSQSCWLACFFFFDFISFTILKILLIHYITFFRNDWELIPNQNASEGFLLRKILRILKILRVFHHIPPI